MVRPIARRASKVPVIFTVKIEKSAILILYIKSQWELQELKDIGIKVKAIPQNNIIFIILQIWDVNYMNNILIRNFREGDEAQILNICYQTGYMGEDLTDRDIFNDIKLFGYLFCSYYYMYEKENCFVAVDKKENKVIGYIIGTLNSQIQEKLFIKKMLPKILIRLASCTLWKHSESYRAVKFFIKNLNSYNSTKTIYKEYPAHLHINILNSYQNMGVGGRLVYAFEEHVRKNEVKGIHLRTSNKNLKAVPFYLKVGYKIIGENEDKVWKGTEGYKNLVFGKKT